MLNLVSNWDTQMAALLSSQTLILTFYFTEFLDISPATTSGFFEARYIELCLVHLKPYNWNQMRDTITGVKQLSWMQFVGWLKHPWGVGGYNKEGSHMKLCLDQSIIWVFYTLGTHKCQCGWKGNVHAQRQKKTLWSVMTAPLSPWQHSNDRLTFPAQNMMARNRALQSHCPECSK